MKWNLVGVLTLVVLESHVPAADACGVKLTVKSSAPRKAVARSSNPSEVLLLGRPPRRLERDLAAGGHHVEVAPTASTAKRKAYAVVIADASMESEARTNFGGAVVIVRSDDVATDIRSVENQIARKPVRKDEGRDLVAARDVRVPLKVGPDKPTAPVLVGSKPATPDPVTPPVVARVETKPPVKPEVKVEPKAVEPKPEPKVIEPKVVEPKVVEPKVVETKPEPKPRPVAVAKAPANLEIYFTVNKSTHEGAISSTAKWLMANASISVIIEGHADPTGNPDDNMALAQKRAEWVRDSLVTAGIDASRLEVISYGDTKLKYGKYDPRNRRTAIIVK